jgi:hypothetical protein
MTGTSKHFAVRRVWTPAVKSITSHTLFPKRRYWHRFLKPTFLSPSKLNEPCYCAFKNITDFTKNSLASWTVCENIDTLESVLENLPAAKLKSLSALLSLPYQEFISFDELARPRVYQLCWARQTKSLSALLSSPHQEFVSFVELATPRVCQLCWAPYQEFISFVELARPTVCQLCWARQTKSLSALLRSPDQEFISFVEVALPVVHEILCEPALRKCYTTS